MLLQEHLLQLNHALQQPHASKVWLDFYSVHRRFEEEYTRAVVQHVTRAGRNVVLWYDNMLKLWVVRIDQGTPKEKVTPTCVGCGGPRKDYVSACDYCKRIP